MSSTQVLDDLAAQRDGEADGEPGKARLREAIAPLLVYPRITELTVGAAVEFAEGEADWPRNRDLVWNRAIIVDLGHYAAKIRMDQTNEEKLACLGSLRLVEDEPSAAAILLAHAAADQRHDIMQIILASDAMQRSPLSFVVGEPGEPISDRTNARATALDHAIASENLVGIGLLSGRYAFAMSSWQAA